MVIIVKESFKNFVRKNPQLAKYVENKKMTWQQFYEIYDLYGENNSIWDDFKDNTNNKSNIVDVLKELIDLFKGIDLATVQKTLSSIDKAIEAFKGFKNDVKDNNVDDDNQYKYFED